MVQSHTFSGVAEGRKPQPWLKHGVPSVMVDWAEVLQNGLGLENAWLSKKIDTMCWGGPKISKL